MFFLFQLLLRGHFLVIIHIVPKCGLLNLSLHVEKFPTYPFSLYVSVNLQSLSLHLLYTTSTSISPGIPSAVPHYMVSPLQAPPLPDRDMKPDEGTPHREGKLLTNDLHCDAAAGQRACGERDASRELWLQRQRQMLIWS